MKTYIPNPLDTEHIVLPEALNELTEQMARNVHEVWATYSGAYPFTFRQLIRV